MKCKHGLVGCSGADDCDCGQLHFAAIEPPDDRRAALQLNAVAIKEALAQLDKVNLFVFEWPHTLRDIKAGLSGLATCAQLQANQCK